MRFSQAPAACAALLIAGCTFAAQQKDDLLIDAGFTPVKTDTPQWAAAMKALPPHRFAHRTVNATPMVFYADPVACKCVYSGTEATYATYKQIRREDMAVFDENRGGGGSFVR